MKKRILSLLLAGALLFGFCPFRLPVVAAGTVSASSPIQNKLKITKQPQSVDVANGKTAKVTVSATGEGLSYKWYFKDKGASKFSLTKTFTGNTYSVAMNAARSGRQLYCKVTDKYGNTVTTKTVTIAMRKALKITKQPQSVDVTNGKTAKVTVSATGEGLSYKWYFKDKGASKFSLTKTFTGNTYSVAMNAARSGRQLYCKVTDKYGNTVTTKTVTIAMRKALKITKQPSSVSAYDDDTARVTVKAIGEGLKYIWYFKDPGKTSFSKATAFSDDAYAIIMDAQRNGQQVYCKITDKYGASVRTKTVTLSMRKTLKITKQPGSVSAYDGKTAKITLNASGEGLKYTWYFKNSGKTSFSKTTSFQSNTYEVPMNLSRHGRQVYCVVTDKYGSSVKTNTVTLSLDVHSPIITCSDCLKKTTGTTFDYTKVYTQSNKLTKLPLTFEAVFAINQKDMDDKMRPLDRYDTAKETVLFSSDDTYEPAVCFSITENGNPKLGLRPKDWYCRFYSFVFDKVNVFSDKPIHLAITIDLPNNSIKCYVNGKLMQTLTEIPKEAKVAFLPTGNYAVGGDLYSANVNYFRGELYSLSVWSDIRSAAEINLDASVGVDTVDPKLLATYDLSACDACLHMDYSTKGNNLRKEMLWQKPTAVDDVGEYDYSFAVIGDTQELSEDDPAAFTKLYQWLVNYKDAKKIKYVLGLGDITQKSYAEEWAHAKTQIYKLNGVLPYLLSRGNHDYDRETDGVVTSGYNVTFNDGIYNQQLTGTMAENDVTNAYRTINICGIDYLFLTLDFGPNAEMLAWADSVVAAHPNHRVIVITHGYLYRDGTTLDADDAYSASKYPIKDRKQEQSEKPSLDGDDMWEQFVSKHANIQMILSGHDPCQHVIYRQDKGENGNTVTQMLIDPQGIDGFYKPSGMVAMFYFSDNGNRLTVRYYSVTHNMYGSESSQFTVDLS